MSSFLIVTASLQGENGNSTRLTRAFTQSLATQSNIVHRHLSPETMPHLTGSEFGAWMTTEAERSPEQQDLTALSDTLIAEVQNADTIVIGMPMYNFGTPSHFKAWVDHIARAGVTFRYTENGPEGLLIGKRVVVLVASGGIYQGTDNDSLTPYLTTFFNFLGIQQVDFIYAEGLAMGDAETPITLAQTQIKALAAAL